MEVPVLRKGFKAVCRATEHRYQNFQIRVHRSLSWLERALEMDEKTQPEGRLLYAWIGLSALYGCWDGETGFAARDGESRKQFLDMLAGIDKGELLADRLQRLKSDILWLMDNKFLDPRFWKNPAKPGNVHGGYQRAERAYEQGQWELVLSWVLERIAVLRGQIVHGAATRGSRLNREGLKRCRKILESLLPLVLQLVIEHRADDQWPPLCYPPLEQ